MFYSAFQKRKRNDFLKMGPWLFSLLRVVVLSSFPGIIYEHVDTQNTAVIFFSCIKYRAGITDITGVALLQFWLCSILEANIVEINCNVHINTSLSKFNTEIKIQLPE